MAGSLTTSTVGKPLDATNVRRAFRQALKDAEGINADEWTPGTAVTEEVYRKQIRPVIQTGAVVMDGIFKRAPERWSRR